MENSQDYAGISEAARVLKVTREAIRQRLGTGNVFGHRIIGGRHHFDKALLTREIWGIKRNGQK